MCVLTAVIITHCTWSPVHSSAGLTLHCALVTSGDKVWTSWGGGTGHRSQVLNSLTKGGTDTSAGVLTACWWWWRGLAGSAGPTGTRRREHRTQNTEQQDPASRERWQRCTSTQPRYYRWSSTLQHQHQPLLEQADTVLGSMHKYLPNFLISQV